MCNFVYCVSFERCVILCDVCCLCVVSIVVPLPPGENTFAVKINNNNIIGKTAHFEPQPSLEDSARSQQ
jgi:hypothetical protein